MYLSGKGFALHVKGPGFDPDSALLLKQVWCAIRK